MPPQLPTEHIAMLQRLTEAQTERDTRNQTRAQQEAELTAQLAEERQRTLQLAAYVTGKLVEADIRPDVEVVEQTHVNQTSGFKGRKQTKITTNHDTPHTGWFVNTGLDNNDIGHSRIVLQPDGSLLNVLAHEMGTTIRTEGGAQRTLLLNFDRHDGTQYHQITENPSEDPGNTSELKRVPLTEQLKSELRVQKAIGRVLTSRGIDISDLGPTIPPPPPPEPPEPVFRGRNRRGDPDQPPVQPPVTPTPPVAPANPNQPAPDPNQYALFPDPANQRPTRGRHERGNVPTLDIQDEILKHVNGANRQDGVKEPLDGMSLMSLAQFIGRKKGIDRRLKAEADAAGTPLTLSELNAAVMAATWDEARNYHGMLIQKGIVVPETATTRNGLENFYPIKMSWDEIEAIRLELKQDDEEA